MRIVKSRLCAMLLGVKVFLDVDSLVEGKGAEVIDASAVVLVFVSKGYAASPNCMRELLRAAFLGKRLIVLMETEARHGGAASTPVAAAKEGRGGARAPRPHPRRRQTRHPSRPASSRRSSRSSWWS